MSNKGARGDPLSDQKPATEAEAMTEGTDPVVLETIAEDMRHDCLQTVYPAELERVAVAIRARDAAIGELRGRVAELEEACARMHRLGKEAARRWRSALPVMLPGLPSPGLSLNDREDHALCARIMDDLDETLLRGEVEGWE